MGKLLIDDFKSQKQNIIWILLIAILGVVIGFAFHAIYHCAGILLSVGACIIYFNSFSDNRIYDVCSTGHGDKKEDLNDDDDRVLRLLRKKLRVRTKFVEIILISIPVYILTSVAFIVNAYDNNLFFNPEFSITGNMEQMMLYPMTMVFLTSLVTPVIFKKRMSPIRFICLAVISILVPYGVYILDFLTGFTANKVLMIILPFPVIGLVFICYFVTMASVLKDK